MKCNMAVCTLDFGGKRGTAVSEVGSSISIRSKRRKGRGSGEKCQRVWIDQQQAFHEGGIKWDGQGGLLVVLAWWRWCVYSSGSRVFVRPMLYSHGWGCRGVVRLQLGYRGKSRKSMLIHESIKGGGEWCGLCVQYILYLYSISITVVN